MMGAVEEEEYDCKAVLIGDGNVGKTCLLVVLTSDTFPAEYVPTIFDNYAWSDPTSNVAVSLVDTAGQEEFASLRPISYENANLFIVCYDVSSSASLKNVEKIWMPEVNTYLKSKSKDVPFLGGVLVGTKADMRFESDKECVDEEKARKVGEKYNMPYMESSALKGFGVKEVFRHVAARWVRYEETGETDGSLLNKRQSKIYTQEPIEEPQVNVHVTADLSKREKPKKKKEKRGKRGKCIIF